MGLPVRKACVKINSIFPTKCLITMNLIPKLDAGLRGARGRACISNGPGQGQVSAWKCCLYRAQKSTITTVTGLVRIAAGIGIFVGFLEKVLICTLFVNCLQSEE